MLQVIRKGGLQFPWLSDSGALPTAKELVTPPCISPKEELKISNTPGLGIRSKLNPRAERGSQRGSRTADSGLFSPRSGPCIHEP